MEQDFDYELDPVSLLEHLHDVNGPRPLLFAAPVQWVHVSLSWELGAANLHYIHWGEQLQ